MGKVYVFCDMEGVSGVSGPEYLIRGSVEYQQAQDWLAEDANCAIAGAFDGGATTVVVSDLHDGGGNLSPDKTDPRARYETLAQISLDQSFTGLILVGHHAKAGTLNGFLDHTMSGRSWFGLRVNDEEVGEIWLAAAYAGHFGVPLIMVTGDEATCREAEGVSPGVVTVTVKHGMGRNFAQCIPPEAAHTGIRQGASRAVAEAVRCPPKSIGLPAVVEVTFCRSDYADSAMSLARFERVDARTIRTVVQTARELYAAMPPG